MKQLALLIPLLAISCATICAPNTLAIKFNTDPPGQTITVDGASYTTPAKVQLSTSESHTVVWPDGSTSKVSRTFQPWFLGNILFGGVIGIIVDVASGAVADNLTPRKLSWARASVTP